MSWKNETSVDKGQMHIFYFNPKTLALILSLYKGTIYFNALSSLNRNYSVINAETWL